MDFFVTSPIKKCPQDRLPFMYVPDMTIDNLLQTFFIYSISLSQESFEIRTGDVYISYLPLAHVYERFAQVSNARNTCVSPFSPSSLIMDVYDSHTILVHDHDKHVKISRLLRLVFSNDSL